MKRTTMSHTLDCLAHPISIGAILLLMTNALVLQRLWPSWWSSKIGDAAWMVFGPFLLAALIALLFPHAGKRTTGLIAFLLTALAFSLLKTTPALNGLAARSAASLGIPLKLAPDPMDLLALPALLIGWRVWNRAEPGRSTRLARAGALALAALAVAADAPPPQELGYTCLVQRGSIIYVVEEYISPGGRYGDGGHHWDNVYRSEDGGETWTRDTEFATTNLICDVTNWPIQAHGAEFFYVVNRGIYRSEDGGNTMTLEQELREVHGAALHEPTGNLVVAAGRDGVRIRTPDGEWEATLEGNPY